MSRSPSDDTSHNQNCLFFFSFFSSLMVQELVELVLTDLQGNCGPGVDAYSQQTCLEVGCGSGAVSLSLLKSLPQVRFVYILGNRCWGRAS